MAIPSPKQFGTTNILRQVIPVRNQPMGRLPLPPPYPPQHRSPRQRPHHYLLNLQISRHPLRLREHCVPAKKEGLVPLRVNGVIDSLNIKITSRYSWFIAANILTAIPSLKQSGTINTPKKVARVKLRQGIKPISRILIILFNMTKCPLERFGS